MAIDTENKRRSVLSYPYFGMAPEADSTLDSGDRAQIAGVYSGFGAPAVALTAVPRWTVLGALRTWEVKRNTA